MRQPKQPFKTLSAVKGFTLIEVVIAIGILSFLLSIGYTSLRNILSSKEILDDGRDARMVTDSVLLRLVRELQLSYSKDMGLMQECGDQNSQPWPSSFSFRGESATGENQSRMDSITFLALEGGQYLPDGGGHSGVVQIRYFMAPTPADDVTGGGPYTLVREEIPYIRPQDKACRKAVIFPITNRILSLQFSYFDPNKDTWTDTWTYPEHTGQPSIVRFSITLKSPAGRISHFKTAVPLRGA